MGEPSDNQPTNGKRATPGISEGWMVSGKALLYFAIAGLSPVISLLDTTAQYDYWPSLQRVTWATASGLLAGMVALRAYFDSSHSRYEDRLNK